MAERISFSPCGNYLAHFNVAGKLRIWETETSDLKHDFTPGSHLSSPCSSFVWVPVSSYSSSVKKKKRKSGECETLLLVLGTDSGQIFFFSLAEGDIINSLKAHEEPVRGITAAPGTDLYSGGGNTIIRWSIGEKKVKSKWKCNVKGYICSMLILDDDKILLTALSSTILCWDVEKKTVLNQLLGHKSNVTSMCYGVSPSNETYVFSAAAEDRLINVWNINNNIRNKPAALFMMPDIPCGISCYINSNGLITFSASSKRGGLNVYSHQINGHCGKPIKPQTTILVTCDGHNTTTKKTELIPIIAGKVLKKNIKIVYGSAPLIKCDSVKLDPNESELFLVRRDPRKSSRPKDESVKKVKNTEASDNVYYLGPSSLQLSGSLKRNNEAMNDEQKETMESLLEKMNITSKENEPSGDALAQLLIQGLNSQDRAILRSVLFIQNERKIKSTVERLPAQAVLPLLKIITNLIQGRTWVSEVAAKWLQALLRTHVGQLLADKGCTSAIDPILGLVETRLHSFAPLSQLKGRLDLLLDQTAQTAPAKPVTQVQPLLVYQDNDSPANSNCLLEDDEEEDENEDWALNEEDNESEGTNNSDDDEMDENNEHDGDESEVTNDSESSSDEDMDTT